MREELGDGEMYATIKLKDGAPQKCLMSELVALIRQYTDRVAGTNYNIKNVCLYIGINYFMCEWVRSAEFFLSLQRYSRKRLS